MTDRVVRLEPQIERADKANFEGLEVLTVVQTGEARAALLSAFNEIDGVENEFAPADSDPIAALAEATLSRDAVFFEAVDEAEGAEILGAMRLSPEGARAHIVALVPAPTKAGTIRLLSGGADDVLSTRPTSIEITRSLARANTSRRRDPAGAVGRVYVFVHAAGGVGATTLAVNSAVELKRRLQADGGNVCILDFDFQYGDVNLQLDVPLHSNLVDLINTPERLDHRMLEDLMVDGPMGLRILTSPESPIPLDVIGAQTIEAIISIARRRYRYVIIDMPLALCHWTDAVLKRADTIFLVTQINVTALRAARRLVDAVRAENALGAPITVIANRYDGDRGGSNITLSQASKAIALPIRATTPSDYSLLIQSLNQGVPAVTLRPASKFSQSLSTA
ncbi:MAG TPA: AAA family ATPase, partial [Parvularculaceae bacterium]|nr:AAA family ATPase [Parvularculaceae bacterium]